MYAIIEAGGKQYRVTEGDILFIEKLEVEDGATHTFDKVLAVDGKVGAPYVDAANVTAKVIKTGRGKKITIFTYRRKNNKSKCKKGHRQAYTKLQIESIKA